MERDHRIFSQTRLCFGPVVSLLLLPRISLSLANANTNKQTTTNNNSDSFGGRSPERVASDALRTLFTFAAAKIILAQLEGSGRGGSPRTTRKGTTTWPRRWRRSMRRPREAAQEVVLADKEGEESGRRRAAGGALRGKSSRERAAPAASEAAAAARATSGSPSSRGRTLPWRCE